MVSLKLSSKCWMEATEQASEHWWQFSMGLGCAGHVLCQAPQLITSSVKMSKCLWWHYLGVCSSPKSLVLPLHWWSVISVSKIKENPSWIPLLPWIFHFVTRTQKKLLYPWWTRTDSQISLKKYLCFFSSLEELLQMGNVRERDTFLMMSITIYVSLCTEQCINSPLTNG